MSNIASILKEEIARVARKEVKRETAALKKASVAYRREIAALKRRALEVERRLQHSSKKDAAAPAPVAANDEGTLQGTRFSAKSIASQRRRLGLSAAEVGLLIGATAQSIYNWEDGKARPRAQHLPAIFALRSLGRRQATAILETRKAA
jgi:DNA-binding transcriptional regulator YiaG